MEFRWSRRAACAVAAALYATVAPWAAQEQGVPTQVLVRAVSRDAKIIYDRVGGAKITIREVSTGKVLAEGIQKGTSGDTDRIMRLPRQRGAQVYDTPGAAGFQATLHLTGPTVVEIVAEGPLGHPQATHRASKTLLLMPGRDILGEGILLEIHGFIVELLQPKESTVAGGELEVVAAVVMT